jgi:hypothetical protein
MMRDELMPGVAIVKELPLPDEGAWPYSVFEVRDDRNGAEYSRSRIAFRFVEVTPHVKMNLFKRLQQLSSHAIPGVLMPLEWHAMPDGGFCVLFESTERLDGQSRPEPGPLWDRLEQIAIGLAELHVRGLSHGHLTLGNLRLDKNGNVQIQGAAWGPLPQWSEGRYVGESTEKIRPEGPHADAEPVPGDDVYALGRAIRSWLGEKPPRLPTRARQRFFDNLVGDDPACHPKDGKDLLGKLRAARATTRFAEAASAAGLLARRMFGLARRRPAKAGIAVLAIAAAILSSWAVIAFVQMKSELDQTKLANADPINTQTNSKTKPADQPLAKAASSVEQKPASPPTALPAPPPTPKLNVRALARYKWKVFANQKDLTFQQMREQIRDDPNLDPQVKAELNRLCDKIDSQSAWNLASIGGSHSGSDLTIDYRYEIKVTGRDTLNSGYAKWDYHPIYWSPNQSITIKPYLPQNVFAWSNRRYFDTPFKAATYSGPVAIWLLAEDLSIGDNNDYMVFGFQQRPEPE